MIPLSDTFLPPYGNRLPRELLNALFKKNKATLGGRTVAPALLTHCTDKKKI